LGTLQYLKKIKEWKGYNCIWEMQLDYSHFSGTGDRAGNRGNVRLGVIQGLALEERVVVVVFPNLSHEEQGPAEILLAT
jgi:hypothetical protein